MASALELTNHKLNTKSIRSYDNHYMVFTDEHMLDTYVLGIWTTINVETDDITYDAIVRKNPLRTDAQAVFKGTVKECLLYIKIIVAEAHA